MQGDNSHQLRLFSDDDDVDDEAIKLNYIKGIFKILLT